MPWVDGMAQRLDHHLFHTPFHALTMNKADAALITADSGYFDKARHPGRIAWLPDWRGV